MTTKTDRELCDAMLNRDDQAAYSMFVARHWRFVYNVCLRYLKNETDASDKANHTFLKFYRYLPRFKWECAATTMLYTTAMRLCSNWARSGTKRKILFNAVSLDEPYVFEDGSSAFLHEVIPDITPDWSSVTELTTLVDEAMKALRPKQRELLHLRKTLDYNEMSARLGKPQGSIKSGLSRARDALVKAMVERNPDMGEYLAKVVPHHTSKCL